MTKERIEEEMTEESLKKALLAVQERIEKAERERAELQQKIAVARQEERLLSQLLELRGRRLTDAQAGREANYRISGEINPTNSLTGHPVIAAVIEELATAGRPVHISDLMRMLHTRKVPIPGSGNQANLISYLRREPQLVRTSRGMYGLSAWGLENMPVVHRKKRRRVIFKDRKGGNTQ
jgi:hypothetical protein